MIMQDGRIEDFAQSVGDFSTALEMTWACAIGMTWVCAFGMREESAGRSCVW
ncbi:MAG: hypothetical protein LBL66_04195 [Clostridiales bacterium]|nr:hypothetical protein [Clostridiales bacterium]